MGCVMKKSSLFKAAAAIAALIASTPIASANPFFLFGQPMQHPAPMTTAPVEQAAPEEERVELPARFRRQIVEYRTSEPAGTIIVDTPNTYLYLVLGNG